MLRPPRRLGDSPGGELVAQIGDGVGLTAHELIIRSTRGALGKEPP